MPRRTRPLVPRRAAPPSASRRTGGSPPRAPLPRVDVQLATLVREVPEGEGWSYEIKYDGYRAIAYVERGPRNAALHVSLVSRNGLSFSERFAPICRALGALDVESAILDGEVCSLDASGRTRFEALQGVMRDRTGAELVYFVFDVLWLDGEDLRGRPLSERRERLAHVVPQTDRGIVRRSESATGDGRAFLDAVRDLGLEGLIAKRVDLPYHAGRSTEWAKVKVEKSEELLVVGFTAPKRSRQRFGALLLGVRDDERGGVRFAGKVGTGFDTRTLEELHERMLPLRSDRPTVIDPPRAKNATWVRPELVAEIRYTEWTADGKLRHPTFLGLREDKAAREVRRERPVALPRAEKRGRAGG